MNLEALLPFILPIIRNALVLYGGYESAVAQSQSEKIAYGLLALAGIVHSMWNAHHKAKISKELEAVKSESNGKV